MKLHPDFDDVILGILSALGENLRMNVGDNFQKNDSFEDEAHLIIAYGTKQSGWEKQLVRNVASIGSLYCILYIMRTFFLCI